MKISELNLFKAKKVAILGYGKEGRSVKNFLKKLGFENISVLDKNDISEREDGIFYKTGEKYLENIGDFD
ncbi:hypothetical protein HXK64_02730, partial [Candidatus Gracilibacteria bacterium]|nr:hypothetical protein [Candidatus Gracilibacteria bacterium]